MPEEKYKEVEEFMLISDKEMSEIFPLELKLIAAKKLERETLVLIVKFFIVIFLISVSLTTKIPQLPLETLIKDPLPLRTTSETEILIQ